MRKVIKGESFLDYTKRDACNASSLKPILESYKTYWHRKRHGFKSQATNLGRFVHTAVLEPHLLKKEYFTWPGNTRAGDLWKCYQAFGSADKPGRIDAKSKSAKLWKTAAEILTKEELANHFPAPIWDQAEDLWREHGGKEAVLEADWEKALAMATSVLEDSVAGPLFSCSIAEEITLLWEACGVQCKVRLDSMDPRQINDVKTTSLWSLDDWSFGWDIRKYKYHMSAAMYSDAFDQLFGVRPAFNFVVVASYEPYEVVVFDMEDGWIQEGRELYMKALERWKTGGKPEHEEEFSKYGIGHSGKVTIPYGSSPKLKMNGSSLTSHKPAADMLVCA